MGEGRFEGFGPMDTTAISRHHNGFGLRGLAEGLHQLMDELPELVGIDMGHDVPHHLVGAVLDCPDHGEQHA